MCKTSTALGQDIFIFDYRPRVTLQIRQQILGQTRKLEQGQENLTAQILVADAIERRPCAHGNLSPKDSGA